MTDDKPNDGWICDVVFPRGTNSERCSGKRVVQWDLEAPEIGMAFRVNLCDLHKTEISVLGQVAEITDGEDADLQVDVMPGEPSLDEMLEIAEGMDLDPTCQCMNPTGLYDPRSGNEVCPRCRHIAHPYVIPCGQPE